MDGVDAVLARLDPHATELIATHRNDMPTLYRDQLMALLSEAPHALVRLGTLDVAIGHLFADAALAVLEASGVAPKAVRAIGSHGQTVRHSPCAATPYTLQIGDPNVIVERTGITTVADFRRRDMAVGGQGAPLVPGFHQTVFRKPGVSRVVVNIGGIANITVLPADVDEPVSGFDTGPGNTLLDAWARKHLGKPMDENAGWAGGATAHAGLLEIFRNDEYFSAGTPKSTGPEYFNLDWIETKIGLAKEYLPPQQIQRTLCDLTVGTISDAVINYATECEELLVCGGGVHNPIIFRGLQDHLRGCKVHSTAAYGLDPDWVEAAAFAWLARETLAGNPGNLPSVTGAARPVILGGVYPAGR